MTSPLFVGHAGRWVSRRDWEGGSKGVQRSNQFVMRITWSALLCWECFNTRQLQRALFD